MRNNYIILLVLVVMVFHPMPAISQTLGEKYDLNFNDIGDCHHSWILSKYNSTFAKDGKTTCQGKNAAELSFQNFKQGKTMRFNLSKTLILPVSISKNCEVSLISKDNVNNDIVFKITGVANDLKELYSDSIKINSSIWHESSLKIKLGQTKAVRINISYNGDNSEDQHVWIDRILIKSGGKDITKSSYFSNTLRDTLKTIASLQKKYVVKLFTGNDSTLLTGIKGIRKKKIIGIGECTHGSNSCKVANYQFIKNLIVSHRCKLVLLEMPINSTLIWNLYIQNKISKDQDKQIKDDLKCSFVDHELLMQFFDWLRTYNKHTISKVYLYGVDDPDLGAKKLYLFNFYLELLGVAKGSFYLKNTWDEKYLDIIKYTRRDPSLKQLLGQQNFNCYLYMLNELTRQAPPVTVFGDRDVNMSKRVISLMKICLKAAEQGVVLAHSGHLQNQERSKGDTTLGYYLRKYYGDQYFSISFQIGKGTFSQDECTPDVKIITDSLKPPPFYSFEYAASATGLPYFYYPAKYLGKAILTYCSISRGARYNDLYAFSSPKKQFDAYVFIRESKPMIKIEPSLLIYNMNYFYNKRIEMDKVMKNLSK